MMINIQSREMQVIMFMERKFVGVTSILHSGFFTIAAGAQAKQRSSNTSKISS